MPKKTQSQVNKEEEARFKTYLDKLQALNKECGFQPAAILHFTDYGIQPQLTFNRYVVPKPKTEQPGDTEDKGTKE